MKHNPAFLTREELVSSFVARQQDLTFVLDHFVENVGASSQHLLIMAPRGMGKTTLVLRAAEALRTEERFSKIWFPLVYAEETYEVTAAAELWLEGLRHLGEYTKNQELLVEHRELRKEKDEARLYDRALGLLLQFAEKEGKRLVLVIENLHMLLGEQLSEGDAWKLRKTLQTERRLCLLATATARFDAIQDVKQAFFEQFRTYRLEPLSIEEAQRLWSHVAGREVPAEQMRPLHILTGGNPRLLTILASFAGEMSLRDLMGDLVRLVDEHTTYFKSNLDSLPAKERKVYVAVADLWQPSTAREVAEQARLSPSEASALLNRLTQRGAVTASGEERRRLYQLAERMYNIYHLLRRSGGDHTRVKAVVDFMVGFYDPVSLGNVVRAIAEEGKELTGDERRDHEAVLESLFEREANPRARELWAEEVRAHLEKWIETPEMLRNELNRPGEERLAAAFRGAGLSPKEAESLLADGSDVSKALAGLNQEESKPIFASFASRGPKFAAAAGFLALLSSLPAEAAKALRKALEEDHPPARRAFLGIALGRSLKMLGQLTEAESALSSALRYAPNDAGLAANLSDVVVRIPGRVQEAIDWALRAIDLDPRVELGWRALLVAFYDIPEADLLSLEARFRGVLDQKKAASRDRTIAGLWAIACGFRTADRRLRNLGFQALARAWKEGIAVPFVGQFALKHALVEENFDDAVEILKSVALSLDSGMIDVAFLTIWISDNPKCLVLALPHLPLLLRDKFLGQVRIPLVGILTTLRKWEEARPHVASLLAGVSAQKEMAPLEEQTREHWTRIFIDAAATGHGKDALDLLSASALAAPLEPVVAGLHAYLGEAYRAPLEVAEVAADVAERIRQRAIALKSRGEATTGTKASPTPKDSAESGTVHKVSTESPAKPGVAKSTGTKRPKARKVPQG